MGGQVVTHEGLIPVIRLDTYVSISCSSDIGGTENPYITSSNGVFLAYLPPQCAKWQTSSALRPQVQGEKY